MINKIEHLEEEDLWKIYKADKNIEARDVLIKKYSPLVKYVAGKVSIGMPPNVEFNDLVGYGTFGLLDAIEKFNPEKHVKFKTYAVTRIRGSIFDELRALDWVPRSVRQKTREVEFVVRKLESSLGRTASAQEIANELGISLKEYEKISVKISGVSLLSLNDTFYLGSESDRVLIQDSIESSSIFSPEDSIEKEEKKKLLLDAIKQLSEKERKVLLLYYYEDFTLKEIGKTLEVTESRVSQLHTRAIDKLRTILENYKNGIF